jgi:preprotein translocase subunit SecE
MKNVMQFLDGVKREFAKVVWPKKKELIGSTLVILFLVFAFAVYLGSVDFVLGRAAAWLLSY